MTFVRENKRAVIFLGVGLAVLCMFLFVKLFSGGSETEALAPAPRGTPSVTPTTVEAGSTQAPGSFVPAPRSDSGDPFQPLPGSKDASAQSGDPGSGSSKAASATKPSVKGSGSADRVSSGNSSGDTSGSSGDKRTDNGTRKDPKKDVKKTPVPIAPQPLDGGKTTPSGKAGQPEVTLLKVGPDSADVRVDGQQETLFLSVPGSTGVTYVSPLPGGCAWMAAAGSADRVTVCEGETVTL